MLKIIKLFTLFSFSILAVFGCGSGAETNTEMNNGDQSETMIDSSSFSGEVLSYIDLSYTLLSGVESDLATLDLFRMDDGQLRPLVLLIHGGSWVGGDKSGFHTKFVPWWMEQGYVVAPVNFRLASKFNETPIVKPRDQVKDIAAALAWLISRADEYKIATDKIVIVGYSSGAHLAALLATDESIFQESGVNTDNILASISLDVHAYDVPLALQLMEDSVVEDNINIIRHLMGQTEMEQLANSPISCIDGWAAQTLIISVDEDPETEGSHGYIVSQAGNHFVNALQEAGHQSRHVHDVTETHNSMVSGFGEEGDITTQAIQDLLDSLP